MYWIFFGTHDHNFSINAIQRKKMQQRKMQLRKIAKERCNKGRWNAEMKFGYIFFEMCEIAIRSYLIIMIMFCLFWLQLFSTIVPKDHRELRREEEEESDGRRQTSISVLPTPYLAYQTYLGPMSRLSVGILYPQKERLPRVSLATRVSRSIAVTTAKNGGRGEDVCF